MVIGGCGRGYESITDANELRIVIRELRRIGHWIDQLADSTAEHVDSSPDCAQGVRMVRAFVVDVLTERARSALRKSESGSRGCDDCSGSGASMTRLGCHEPGSGLS